jgi:hypothetical protein
VGTSEDLESGGGDVSEETTFQNFKLATLYAESLHPAYREEFLRLFFRYSRDPLTSSSAFQLAFDGFAPGGDGQGDDADDNDNDDNGDDDDAGEGEGEGADAMYGIALGELQSSLQQRYVRVAGSSGTRIARPVGHASDRDSSIGATYVSHKHLLYT